MYSVLVIDDEKLTRQTIIKILNENFPECNDIYQAENAPEGIDKIKEFNPNIIITDICLGQMSGLDMLELLNPKSKVIVLTGYRDFEYAQRSININVSAFLLKPIRPSVLIDAVSSAISKIDEESSKRSEFERLNTMLENNLPYIRQKILLDIIYGISTVDLTGSHGSLDVYDIKIKDFYMVLIEIQDIKNKLDDKSMHIIQCDAISMLEESAGSAHSFESLLLDRTKLLIIFKNENDTSSEKALVSLCSDFIDRFAKKYPDINTAIGISTLGSGENELCTKFNESKRALFYIHALGANTIICFGEISFNEQTYILHQELFKLKTSLVSAIDDGDYTAIEHYVSQITKKAESSDISELDFIKRFYMQILLYINDLRNVFKDNIPSEASEIASNIEKMTCGCDDISVLNEVLIISVRNILQKKDDFNKENISKHVQNVLDFIKQNYASAISLDDIADYTQLSVEHICRLFKKETNKNIIDYINEFRIDRAKQFLDSGKYKIYEVAEMVGIQNTTYFSTMFKNYTGITPSEYLRQ